jgi:hypothetical protein
MCKTSKITPSLLWNDISDVTRFLSQALHHQGLLQQAVEVHSKRSTDEEMYE